MKTGDRYCKRPINTLIENLLKKWSRSFNQINQKTTENEKKMTEDYKTEIKHLFWTGLVALKQPGHG